MTVSRTIRRALMAGGLALTLGYVVACGGSERLSTSPPKGLEGTNHETLLDVTGDGRTDIRLQPISNQGGAFYYSIDIIPPGKLGVEGWVIPHIAYAAIKPKKEGRDGFELTVVSDVSKYHEAFGFKPISLSFHQECKDRGELERRLFRDVSSIYDGIIAQKEW